jgi:phosphopantothenoylcysteine decarboxylase/phosphopantothenate--cysteine ligase
MSSLKGKKILLGVSGSIAAYKSAFLVRQLVKEGLCCSGDHDFLCR